MKIGLFTALFGDLSLDQMLERVHAEGIQMVELGAGAYPGSAHLAVHELLESAQKRKDFLQKLERYGLGISAISVHGNPLHPNQSIAQQHHNDFVHAVQLAEALGVSTVNGFSGCPGDHEGAVNPNWVTCAWPDEFRTILDWQWNEKVLPYWTEQADFLEKHQVNFAIEMHPGFVVYNPDTLLKLRNGAGANGRRIGANFDPSHLWWQGMDPLAALRKLMDAGALFHVHAKDLRIDPLNSSVDGNLDCRSYGDIASRSWVFRTVGYGHPLSWWRNMVSELRARGYDGVLSIEHEDGLMSINEGLRRAVAALQSCIIQEPAGPMFWAEE